MEKHIGNYFTILMYNLGLYRDKEKMETAQKDEVHPADSARSGAGQ